MHRSHFGSRYTLGFCFTASLVWIPCCCFIVFCSRFVCLCVCCSLGFQFVCIYVLLNIGSRYSFLFCVAITFLRLRVLALFYVWHGFFAIAWCLFVFVAFSVLCSFVFFWFCFIFICSCLCVRASSLITTFGVVLLCFLKCFCFIFMFCFRFCCSFFHCFVLLLFLVIVFLSDVLPCFLFVLLYIFGIYVFYSFVKRSIFKHFFRYGETCFYGHVYKHQPQLYLFICFLICLFVFFVVAFLTLFACWCLFFFHV